MADNLHPVEAAWRHFHSGEGASWLMQCESMRQPYLESIGLASCPDEIVLPSGATTSALGTVETMTRGDREGSFEWWRAAAIPWTVCAWAAYQKSKTIYLIGEELAEMLSETAWPERALTAALRLPSPCAVLDIPHEDEHSFVAAYYNLLTGQEASGAAELRLCSLFDDRWHLTSILHLTGETLGECVDRAEAVAATYRAYTRPVTFKGRTAGFWLTLLLYLAGQNDIVRTAHPEVGSPPTVEARGPEYPRLIPVVGGSLEGDPESPTIVKVE